MIRWKVVKKGDRSSCMLHYPNKYRKIYKKGKIVKAIKGSLGIFCFGTKRNAERFKPSENFIIIKIKSIGKERYPIVIGNYWDVKYFYEYINKDRFSANSNIPVEGTICCPAVKVLE